MVEEVGSQGLVSLIQINIEHSKAVLDVYCQRFLKNSIDKLSSKNNGSTAVEYPGWKIQKMSWFIVIFNLMYALVYF